MICERWSYADTVGDIKFSLIRCQDFHFAPWPNPPPPQPPSPQGEPVASRLGTPALRRGKSEESFKRKCSMSSCTSLFLFSPYFVPYTFSHTIYASSGLQVITSTLGISCNLPVCRIPSRQLSQLRKTDWNSAKLAWGKIFLSRPWLSSPHTQWLLVRNSSSKPLRST